MCSTVSNNHTLIYRHIQICVQMRSKLSAAGSLPALCMWEKVISLPELIYYKSSGCVSKIVTYRTLGNRTFEFEIELKDEVNGEILITIKNVFSFSAFFLKFVCCGACEVTDIYEGYLISITNGDAW